MGIRIVKNKAPFVGVCGSSVSVSDNDTTPGTLNEKLDTGIALEKEVLDSGGDETLEVRSAVKTIYDQFEDEKPFWQSTQALRSGDFQIDTGVGNKYLEGIAENNDYDRIRYSVEGDFDYSMFVARSSASRVGWRIDNADASKTIKMELVSGKIEIRGTGVSNHDHSVAGSAYFMRVQRTLNEIYFYIKDTYSTKWIRIYVYSGYLLGSQVDVYLKSGNTQKIYEMILSDNVIGSRVRSDASLEYPLVDGATINLDASLANTFTVTLGGNRTLANPTNPTRNQKIILRVYQDGTGNRTLSYGTKYRFSDDIPEPTLTTDADHFDYLGFIYNEDDDKWDCVALVQGFDNS